MEQALVLVLNAGSSSLKAAVLQVENGASSTTQSLWQQQWDWGPSAAEKQLLTEPGSIAACLAAWLPAALEPWRQALTLVGHRLVHGGRRFGAPVRLDPQVRSALAELSDLAPLHNAAAVAVIDWMETWLAQWQPDLDQWACFDTAFHSTLPARASTYALPSEWRQKGMRRYGFHGLNHQHVSETVTALLREQGQDDDQLAQLRLISAHLGAGCSLCAIAGGRSVATSMGFTPLEGLVMATRSGSVDPGLLLHLLQHETLTPGELSEALNHRSGLLGLSDLSGDMRALRQAAARGHDGAQLAIAVFLERLLEGIGAMAATLQGVDVIALSGGIGQNDEELAHTLHSALQWLGPFRLLQIPADEEGQIARQCLRAAGR